MSIVHRELDEFPQEIERLDVKMVCSKGEVVRLSPQIMVAHGVCDRFWGVGYTLAL